MFEATRQTFFREPLAENLGCAVPQESAAELLGLCPVIFVLLQAKAEAPQAAFQFCWRWLAASVTNVCCRLLVLCLEGAVLSWWSSLRWDRGGSRQDLQMLACEHGGFDSYQERSDLSTAHHHFSTADQEPPATLSVSSMGHTELGAGRWAHLGKGGREEVFLPTEVPPSTACGQGPPAADAAAGLAPCARWESGAVWEGCRHQQSRAREGESSEDLLAWAEASAAAPNYAGDGLCM